MTPNLYDELNLSRELAIDEININLSQLERIWHQREINQPEKAHKMLALIDEARIVFKTLQSKADYDKSLDSVQNTHDERADNTAKILQWKDAANEYFTNGQYDLAEAALEKAFAFPESTEDESLFILAGNIYHNSGKYDKAIDLYSKLLFDDSSKQSQKAEFIRNIINLYSIQYKTPQTTLKARILLINIVYLQQIILMVPTNLRKMI